MPLWSAAASTGLHLVVQRIVSARRPIGALAVAISILAVVFGLTRSQTFTATSSFVIVPPRPPTPTLGGGIAPVQAPRHAGDPEFYLALLRSRCRRR